MNYLRQSKKGMFKVREIEKNNCDIWRVFISGSSGSGKTYFAEKLLQKKFFKFERIYYYHPDLQESFPTNWKDNFSEPVLYQAGLPTEDELLSMPQYSCVVFDDLFTKACESRLIDYLFRVLSSKRKIHCIIMTQRYFAEGSNGLNIRNSSNYHVLMNNADERTNLRVSDTMNLRKEVNLAIKENHTELYPYIFIDRSNHARVNGLQIYIDIFSRYQKAIHKLMLVYLVSEADFKSNFNLLDDHTAIKNENTIERVSDSCQATENKRDSWTTKYESVSGSRASRFHQRKRFKREVERIIHRYNLKTKL